jgi:lipoate-protein ligase A
LVKAFLLETPAFDLFRNMAVDEALFFEKVNALRFYQWKSPCYSIGYFQKSSQCPKDLPLVRRLTGGGTVRHEGDLTFSLVLNIHDFPNLKVLEDSYYLIHCGVLEGLRKVGVKADLVEKSVPRPNGFCFQAPVRGDLLLNDQKILGGAQRRKAGRLLYQGTLQITDKIESQVKFKDEIAAGLERVFGLEFIKRDAILAGLESQTESLEKKYRSEKWANRF